MNGPLPLPWRTASEYHSALQLLKRCHKVQLKRIDEQEAQRQRQNTKEKGYTPRNFAALKPGTGGRQPPSGALPKAKKPPQRRRSPLQPVSSSFSRPQTRAQTSSSRVAHTASTKPASRATVSFIIEGKEQNDDDAFPSPQKEHHDDEQLRELLQDWEPAEESPEPHNVTTSVSLQPMLDAPPSFQDAAGLRIYMKASNGLRTTQQLENRRRKRIADDEVSDWHNITLAIQLTVSRVLARDAVLAQRCDQALADEVLQRAAIAASEHVQFRRIERNYRLHVAWRPEAAPRTVKILRPTGSSYELRIWRQREAGSETGEAKTSHVVQRRMKNEAAKWVAKMRCYFSSPGVKPNFAANYDSVLHLSNDDRDGDNLVHGHYQQSIFVPDSPLASCVVQTQGFREALEPAEDDASSESDTPVMDDRISWAFEKARKRSVPRAVSLIRESPLPSLQRHLSTDSLLLAVGLRARSQSGLLTDFNEIPHVGSAGKLRPPTSRLRAITSRLKSQRCIPRPSPEIPVEIGQVRSVVWEYEARHSVVQQQLMKNARKNAARKPRQSTADPQASLSLQEDPQEWMLSEMDLIPPN